MESMDTVSLQAVTLADGSTAYIQHDSKASFSDGQIMDGQVIQLEDGSAAYVQHVSMPKAGKWISGGDGFIFLSYEHFWDSGFPNRNQTESCVFHSGLQHCKPACCYAESPAEATVVERMFSLLQEGRVYSWRTDKQFSWKTEQRPTFILPKVKNMQPWQGLSLSLFLSHANIIQLLSAY